MLPGFLLLGQYAKSLKILGAEHKISLSKPHLIPQAMVELVFLHVASPNKLNPPTRMAFL